MLRYGGGYLAAVVALCLGGCGTVVWTENDFELPPGGIDGAAIEYFLPEGILEILAKHENGALTAAVVKQSIRPDSRRKYKLIYNHSGFSHDEITVEQSEGLITSISTTTTDKTASTLESVKTLITQASATMTALAPSEDRMRVSVEAKPRGCPNMQVTYIQSITYGEEKGAYHPPKGSSTEDCSIKVKVTAIPKGQSSFGMIGFPNGHDPNPVFDTNPCTLIYAFCFRSGQFFEVNITATLIGTNPKPLKVTVPPFVVAAPSKDRMSYVRFDRRAFVANKTSISFDKNGLVSRFHAVNPSEVFGSISVPTALAAGVAAGVALGR